MRKVVSIINYCTSICKFYSKTATEQVNETCSLSDEKVELTFEDVDHTDSEFETSSQIMIINDNEKISEGTFMIVQ